MVSLSPVTNNNFILFAIDNGPKEGFFQKYSNYLIDIKDMKHIIGLNAFNSGKLYPQTLVKKSVVTVQKLA